MPINICIIFLIYLFCFPITASSADETTAVPSRYVAHVAAGEDGGEGAAAISSGCAAALAGAGPLAYSKPNPIRTPLSTSSTSATLTSFAARRTKPENTSFDTREYPRVDRFVESLRRDIPEFHQLFADRPARTPRDLFWQFRVLETMFDNAVLAVTSYPKGLEHFGIDLAYLRTQERHGLRRSTYKLLESYMDDEEKVVEFASGRKACVMHLRGCFVTKLPICIVEHAGRRCRFVLDGRRDNFLGLVAIDDGVAKPEEAKSGMVVVKSRSDSCGCVVS